MTDLNFITGNQLKYQEVTAVLGEVNLVDVDLPEIQEVDPRKVIEAKLATATSMGLTRVMVEDTSLYLESMNGLPGPLIKWFLLTIGTQGLYDLAARSGNTNAEAKTIIGVALKSGDYRYFEGAVSGTLVPPRGVELGWNSIFQPDGSERTFGEMTDEERLGFSMRRIAAEQLRDLLEA